MDGAMAQDKTTVDEDSEVRPEPTLSMSVTSASPEGTASEDTASEPPFQSAAPMQFLPPPIPKPAAESLFHKGASSASPGGPRR